MKRIAVVFALLLGFVSTLWAQIGQDTSEVFVVVEQDPEFPGGYDSLYGFISSRLVYPAEAKANGIEGKVYLQFIVEKDGSLSCFRLLRDIGGGCGQAALEVLKQMPRWIPAKQRGNPVRFLFNLPVQFCLDQPNISPADTTMSNATPQLRRLRQLIGPKWFSTSENNNFIVIEQNQKCGIASVEGEVLLPCIYDAIYNQVSYSQLLVENDSLLGVLDRNLNWVLPLEYNRNTSDWFGVDWEDFVDDNGCFFTLYKNGYYGIVDTNGRTVVPFIYKNYIYYYPKHRIVQAYDAPLSLMLRDGDTLGSFTSLRLLEESGEDLFLAAKEKFGVVDFNGKVVIPFEYRSISKSDKYFVCHTDSTTTLRDEKGRILTTAKGELGYACDGWLFCDDGSHCGFMSLKGDTIIRSSKFVYAEALDSKTLCMGYEDSIWLFDCKGRLKDCFRSNYFYDYDFFDHPYVVSKNGLYGFYDNHLKPLIPCRYKFAYRSGRQMLVALNDSTMTLIDRKGHPVVQGPYSSIVPIGNTGLFHVCMSDLHGVIDAEGHSTFTDSEMAIMYKECKVWIAREIDATSETEALSEEIPTENEAVESVELIDPVMVDPEFPGGMDSLCRFLCYHLQYPDSARVAGVEGKVFVLFVVEKDGTVRNFKILRDIGYGCGESVVEALKQMPRWIPGKQGDKTVRVQYSLPVNFSLEKGPLGGYDCSQFK